MNGRKIILTIFSIFIVLLFFRLAPYKNWFNDRILVFRDEIYNDIYRMDLEERKEYRWGGPYIGIKTIRNYLDTSGALKNAILLLPSKNYIAAMDKGIMIPEPVIVYYYSGIRATTVDCKDVYKANGCILSSQGQVVYQKLNNKEEVKAVIDLYKNTKPL